MKRILNYLTLFLLNLLYLLITKIEFFIFKFFVLYSVNIVLIFVTESYDPKKFKFINLM